MLAQLRQVSTTNRRTYGDNIADDLFLLLLILPLFRTMYDQFQFQFQLQFQRNVNREQKVKLIELTEL